MGSTATKPAQADFKILGKILEIITKHDECVDGSVPQRFCLAILQKMSIKEEVVEYLFKESFLDWLLTLLEKATSKKSTLTAPRGGTSTLNQTDSSPNGIHVFCLDFASALLANIFHSY